jgi:hypothetical protein
MKNSILNKFWKDQTFHQAPLLMKFLLKMYLKLTILPSMMKICNPELTPLCSSSVHVKEICKNLLLLSWSVKIACFTFIMNAS